PLPGRQHAEGQFAKRHGEGPARVAKKGVLIATIHDEGAQWGETGLIASKAPACMREVVVKPEFRDRSKVVVGYGELDAASHLVDTWRSGFQFIHGRVRPN